MADRTLVRNYRLDAVAQSTAPHAVADQLIWLEAQRVLLSVEVSSGDIEITAASLEGGTASGRRTLTAHDRLAAVIQAMDQLNETETGASKMIYAQISGIHD